MSLTVFLLALSALLSLPGGLFASVLMSEARARWASMIGGIIGSALVAGGIYYFINAAHVQIDALSFSFGAFFACSVGVFVGALVANFLVGVGRRKADYSSAEL